MVRSACNHPQVILLIFSALLAGVCINASAQDSHYWNHQYGTKANLLGGAVVGSIKDLSATYYNPAAIFPTIDSSLVLSTEVLMFEDIKIYPGIPEDVSFNSLMVGTAPSIFAVRIPLGGLRNHQLACSYLNRQKFKAEIGGKRITSDITLPDGTYVEHFAGEYLAYQYLAEDWIGVTWAFSRGERAFSHRERAASRGGMTRIGISTYAAYRSQRRRNQTIDQIVPGTGAPITQIILGEERFWNVRLLWKIGITTYIKPLVLGLTVTTPSVSLSGSGSSFANASLFGLDLDGDQMPDDLLAADFQEDIPAYYRTPISIAFGTSYGYRTMTFHLTVEWFNRVKRFDVMEIEPFVTQTTGDTIYIDYSHELDHVFNIGVGYDYEINEDLALYGSFTTDFSAFIHGSDTKLAVTSWDIYHLTAGSTFAFYNINFTLGLGFSFGTDMVEPIVDFAAADLENLLQREPRMDEVKYRRLKFLFGVSF